MGYVAELLDTYSREHLRAEVDRLSRGHARATARAERDREALKRVARSVFRRVDIQYARQFVSSDRVISGLTLPVQLDVDTVRQLLAAIDSPDDRAIEARALREAADKPYSVPPGE